MSDLFILQGGPEVEWIFADDQYDLDHCYWTCPKSITKGGVALVYLTSPISSIIGSASVGGEPFFNSAATSMFDNAYMNDKWCVRLDGLIYLGRHAELSMANLRSLFEADWGRVRYPRGSTRVPDDIEPVLLGLLAPFLPELEPTVETAPEGQS